MRMKPHFNLKYKYMTTHKNSLHSSKRYWEKQIDRVVSGEYISKTPIDILLKGINTQLSHIDEELFQLSLT